MDKKPKCQKNNCTEDANLLAWGKWVCGKCYSLKVKELNASVWE